MHENKNITGNLQETKREFMDLTALHNACIPIQKSLEETISMKMTIISELEKDRNRDATIAESRIISLEKQLSSLTAECSQVTASSNASKLILARVTKELESLKKEHTTCEEQIQTLRNKLENVSNNATQDHATLQLTLENTEKSAALLRTESNDLKNKNLMQSDRIKELEKELLRAMERVNKLQYVDTQSYEMQNQIQSKL